MLDDERPVACLARRAVGQHRAVAAPERIVAMGGERRAGSRRGDFVARRERRLELAHNPAVRPEQLQPRDHGLAALGLLDDADVAAEAVVVMVLLEHLVAADLGARARNHLGGRVAVAVLERERRLRIGVARLRDRRAAAGAACTGTSSRPADGSSYQLTSPAIGS